MRIDNIPWNNFDFYNTEDYDVLFLDFGKFNKLRNQIDKLERWFTRFKQELRKREIFLDLIIITGDIASEGLESDFKKAKQFLKKTFSEFLKKMVIVPVNHDLRWVLRENKKIKHKLRFRNFLQFLNDLGLIKRRIPNSLYFLKPHTFKIFPIRKNRMNMKIHPWKSHLYSKCSCFSISI